MARRVSKKISSRTIPLVKPDRTSPDPRQDTLLDIAAKRGLLKKEGGTVENEQEDCIDESLDSPGRFGESVLWSISLAMLHFTFDVLVQHQYAEEISWGVLIVRGLQAYAVFLVLFYALHPHPSLSIILPQIPPSLHQVLFFASSVGTGCYLIYITNEHSYYAQMKRSPSLGCLWIWSVIELDLKWALVSLVFCAGFLKYGQYSYL